MKKEKKYIVIITFVVFIGLFFIFFVSSFNSKKDISSYVNLPVINSREEAQEIMEEFLLEKYGETYDVSLPARTDDGNFQAYFYDPGEQVIEVDVRTGECKDSKVTDIVLTYFEDSIKGEIDSAWNHNTSNFLVNFVDSVPSKDWDIDSNPLDIIKDENMYLTMTVLVNVDNINKNDEVEKVKSILNLNVFNNINLTLIVFYVNNDNYYQIIDNYQNNMYNNNRLYFYVSEDSYYNKLLISHNHDEKELLSSKIMESFAN